VRSSGGSSGDIELNWLGSRDEFGGHGDFRRQAFPALCLSPLFSGFRVPWHGYGSCRGRPVSGFSHPPPILLPVPTPRDSPCLPRRSPTCPGRKMGTCYFFRGNSGDTLQGKKGGKKGTCYFFGGNSGNTGISVPPHPAFPPPRRRRPIASGAFQRRDRRARRESRRLGKGKRQTTMTKARPLRFGRGDTRRHQTPPFVIRTRHRRVNFGFDSSFGPRTRHRRVNFVIPASRFAVPFPVSGLRFPGSLFPESPSASFRWFGLAPFAVPPIPAVLPMLRKGPSGLR